MGTLTPEQAVYVRSDASLVREPERVLPRYEIVESEHSIFVIDNVTGRGWNFQTKEEALVHVDTRLEQGDT